jgi:integrase
LDVKGEKVMPKIKTIREDIIDDAEVARTIMSCRTAEMKAFVSVLALTGGRISEVRAIRAKDVVVVDQDCWTISLLTLKQRPEQWKIPPRRTLKFPMSPLFEKIIKPFINNSKFASEQLIFPKTSTFYYRRLKEANPESYPHLFRHSLATRLSERVDAFDMKEWFGWKCVSMADSYVHNKKAIDKIYNIQKKIQEDSKKE